MLRGITYDADAMKLIDDLGERGVPVGAVVITRYQEQPAAATFKARLENRGINSGYAKFETFPIWNLPLKHPVNVACEAATAELKDVNQVDHFHLEARGEQAVNYNRDLEAFPLLKRIIERITGGESFYRSPTDMGVNRAGFGIVNDAVGRTPRGVGAKRDVLKLTAPEGVAGMLQAPRSCRVARRPWTAA